MNRVLLKIRLLYDNMGRAERRIADCLLDGEGASRHTIAELSAKSGSSLATVVRFARRLGFDGYAEMKLALAAEGEARSPAPALTEMDSCAEILGKLAGDAYLSLERTTRTVSGEALDAAGEALAAAGQIVLLGLGSSGAQAHDTADKLLRAGCHAAAYTDTHMQAVAVSYLTQGDVALGISHSGASRDVVESLRAARRRGAVTLAVTGTANSPITRVADILLLSDPEETRHSILSLSSHLSRLLLLDALVFSVAYRNRARVEQSMAENEETLETKRLP